jgi:hypothetical protein
MVYGLRIGFEEASVVQEKVEEAYIPSMADHRKLYERRPNLRRFNSLERFRTMRRAAGEKKALDLSRAKVLREAIIEFDPAFHEPSTPPGFARTAEGQGDGTEDGVRVRELHAEHGRRRATSRAEHDTEIAVSDGGNAQVQPIRSSSREVASPVEVSELVEPGDVLVIDRVAAGMMRRGFESHDAGVVGVVSENAGAVLVSESPGTVDDESRAEVAMAGVVHCKADAGYGAIWPGDLLVTSPTPGHAMRTDAPLPGTIVGKALEPLEDGTGLIRILVMLR